MLLVHQGSPDEGAEFLAKRWPGARAVSDQNKRLHAAFGLGRASLGQLFGPSVWRRAIGALRFGVGFSRPVGDPFTLGGAFLVREGEVLDARPAEDAGTLPDFDGLARTAMALG
ncbi:MAG: AhpC/TSA family protein [Planctomycetota bacterium]|nr:AhpC/TSA family protein [Planctomycetota bacterium]MEE2940744.1 AhpC/TSA family protein [Planctomycetota bacterium]